MKLQKILLGLPAAIVLATPASAIQINWGSAVDSVFRDSTGTPLDETFAIQLGYFESVLGEPFVPTATNAAEWSSHWKVFDQAAFNPEEGYFTSSAVMNSTGGSSYSPLGVDFSNQEAYIWIHNTETPGPTAEWFLGRSATASASTAAWNLPAKPADDCCDTTVLEWSVTDLDSGDTPVYGKQGEQTGAGVFSDNAPGYTLQTFTFAPVPEPSSSLLLALGGMAVALRRRRPHI